MDVLPISPITTNPQIKNQIRGTDACLECRTRGLWAYICDKVTGTVVSPSIWNKMGLH